MRGGEGEAGAARHPERPPAPWQGPPCRFTSSTRHPGHRRRWWARRPVRALLVVCVLAVAALVLRALDGAEGADWALVAAPMAAAVARAVLVRRESTVLGEDGVRVRGPLTRTRLVAWADVAGVAVGGGYRGASSLLLRDGSVVALPHLPREVSASLADHLGTTSRGRRPQRP